jgi:hypothetical protein
MSWPKAMPLVEVEWFDSSSTDEWRPADKWDEHLDETGEAMHCRSVGWLFRRDRLRLVLFANMSENGALCGMMDIPRVAVRNMRIIEPEAKAKKS